MAEGEEAALIEPVLKSLSLAEEEEEEVKEGIGEITEMSVVGLDQTQGKWIALTLDADTSRDERRAPAERKDGDRDTRTRGEDRRPPPAGMYQHIMELIICALCREGIQKFCR